MKIVTPTGYTSGIIVVGNDNPNFYGTNSYIEIKNMQLEENTVPTVYETFYVTRDTIVSQNKNHTLTAI